MYLEKEAALSLPQIGLRFLAESKKLGCEL